jgi:Family of unknown function (DUF6527)
MTFELERVRYMPHELRPGVLFVSDEFGIALHLCACGCGSKIRTALGPTEFSVTDTPEGPTVRPSVGNWQHPCRSHYWITRGKVVWAETWTSEQIAAGRAREEATRRAYYDERERRRRRVLWRFWSWFRALFSR